jgi:hypothetical protein
VDRVGGGQCRKRRLWVEVQLGRHPGNLGGGRRWTRLGEERAEQAPVQLAQRAGQDSQAILDAAGRQPDPGGESPDRQGQQAGWKAWRSFGGSLRCRYGWR